MALTTTSKVRLLTNITTDEVSNSDITNLIVEATKEIMSKINVKVIREYVNYIDSTRENKIDGSNTIYYVRNWEGKYLGDQDLDGDVDTSDVKVIIKASDDSESEATVSAIDSELGKITLSSAPTPDQDVFISYSWTYFDPVTPDPLLSLACTYLVASYAYLKRDAGLDGSVKFGNVTINEKLSSSYGEFYKKYLDIMRQLNKQSLGRGLYRESKVKI